MAPPEPTLPASAEGLAEPLLAYCRARRPEATALRITQLERIFGGASRQTWRFTLHEESAGQARAHPLILRQDPPASLIQTERRREVAALRAFAHSAVPVPQVWWLEEDPAHLGSPFFVMQALIGGEAAPLRLMAPPYAAHHARMAQQTWQVLGSLARADPQALQGTAPQVEAAHAWRHELDHWAATLRRECLEPQPITEAAIRWLHAHPPPPAQRLAIVHGDYRVGNLLYTPQGDLLGVLDWELAHVGDPLEDLAWGLNRVWCFQRDERVGGLVPREQALAAWEATSGLRAEPVALHWWELFSCVKGQAIWLGAARAVHEGSNRDVMLVLAAWALGNSQERAMLELLDKLQA